jgi:CreA protein
MALISVDGTINISMSVKDRHASATWYESLLGFKTLYHADEAGWSELQTNTVGVTIGLGEHTKPAPGNCVPVFGIADLDTARQKL